jgi:hypothetical protein
VRQCGPRPATKRPDRRGKNRGGHEGEEAPDRWGWPGTGRKERERPWAAARVMEMAGSGWAVEEKRERGERRGAGETGPGCGLCGERRGKGRAGPAGRGFGLPPFLLLSLFFSILKHSNKTIRIQNTI